jgi:hypothetical protein
MKVFKEDFDWAAARGLITPEQSDALWEALSDKVSDRPQFNFASVAYYFGALIVIAAMSWFMTLAWESFGGAGIFTIASLYALLFVLAGRTLWFHQNLKVPGGLLFSIAVCMTPLAIYGLQRWTGMWPQGDPGAYRDYHIWVKASWLPMELGTILAALIALKFVRFPFLTAPIAFTLWYMSMDLTPLLFGQTEFTWEQRLLVSLWFGIATLVAAYLVDIRTRRRDGDFAFWLYLFGLLSFWFGMTIMRSDSEIQRFIYCLIDLGLMLLSVILRRKVFMVFGAFGVFSYLSYLAYSIFQNSLMFPFVLTALGISIIYFGVLYQRNSRSMERLFDRLLPEGFKRLLPRD